ncbi:PAS-domain containing protein [Algicella marina]|uniref:PAS domain-containing protein n=1 Tax=Algicella marina TaxID=2683284 RepID=A0A6P1SZS4_9RHOB|nr:PAS-domain containing protein [Algicella marina]QHQ35988.1 hypothetical protein GO499_12805 [Algicella marina]
MLALSPLFVSGQWVSTALLTLGETLPRGMWLLACLALLCLNLLWLLSLLRVRRKASQLEEMLKDANPGSTVFRLCDTHAEVLNNIGSDNADVWPHSLLPVLSRKDFEALFENGSEVIGGALSALIDNGTSFKRLACLSDGTPVQISGQPVGLTVEIEVVRPTPQTEEVFAAASRASRLQLELDELQRHAEAMPLALAEFDSEGERIWHNEAFTAYADSRPLTHDIPEILAHPPARPIAWPGQTKDFDWFRTCALPGKSGTTHLALIPAEEEIRAREALQNLMNTLADTFAHLNIGLAVFGQKQSLTMFNPALAILFDLDPVALAKQPSLRAFLDGLRHHRRLPEMRSFTEWRDALLNLGQKGNPSSYQEDWTLPSGKVISVIVRHHPGGALVFMFEDISVQIMLERRYRQEIEISQTTLDCLQDGVVVFNTAGALIFSNTAFDQMWNMRSMGSLNAPILKDLVGHMSALSDCTPIWNRLRNFVQSAHSRSSWTADIPMKNGMLLEARFTTLPDGSAMGIFHKLRDREESYSARSGGHATANSVAAYLEDRFGNSAVSLKPTTVLPEGLPDDLALVAMLSRIEMAEGLPGLDRNASTIDKIEALLTGMGYEVDRTAWPHLSIYEHWNVTLRQIVWSLALTAAGSAVPGSVVKLSGTLEENQIKLHFAITAAEPIVAEHARFSGRTLLQKLVADLGGNLIIDTAGAVDDVQFSFTLPIFTPRADRRPNSLKVVS